MDSHCVGISRSLLTSKNDFFMGQKKVGGLFLGFFCQVVPQSPGHTDTLPASPSHCGRNTDVFGGVQGKCVCTSYTIQKWELNECQSKGALSFVLLSRARCKHFRSLAFCTGATMPAFMLAFNLFFMVLSNTIIIFCSCRFPVPNAPAPLTSLG